MQGFSRLLFFITALVAWGALFLQSWLLIGNLVADGASVASAIWRFFGFFTILTNCAVALASTILAINPQSVGLGPRIKLSLATAIVLVGIVYSIALRSVWEPTGLQALVDHALHDVTPLLFLSAWAFGDRGTLDWKDCFWALVAPAAYCVYAMARGALDGWYAYYFLDPSALTAAEIAVNIAGLLLIVLGLAFGLVLLDRILKRL